MKKTLFLCATIALSLSMAGSFTAEAAKKKNRCPGGSYQTCFKKLTAKGVPPSNASKGCQVRCEVH